MKRFQIVILTIMLASLSACATNSLPSSSTESSVSISVSNPQDFLSELEDMETGQILEELKISDGGYSALRLGSVYRFDTDSRYDVVKTNKYGTTALTTVVYQDGANAEPVNNWGILSYNNEKECFVAVELESNSVSESQVLEIAKSIEF